MERTPASLLERLQQPSDTDAWARFVQLYGPLIRHWAHRLGLRGDDAADLVQEVFSVLVEKLPQFRYDPQKRFRAWLWTLTHNKWREGRRRRTLTTTQASEEALASLAAPDEAPPLDEREYQQILVQRALRLMQTDFEPSTWRAFWESVVNDQPAAEVAAELNLSIESVYTAKSRVLRRLRRELEGLLD